MGGLSKKIYQINSLSDTLKNNRLLLDSGNLLFKKNVIELGVNQEKLTAETIMDIYQNNSYDAVGVGPLDLSAGKDFILQSYHSGFPWISINAHNSSGKPLFKEWITRQLGDTTVIITALTGSTKQSIEGITIQPWEISLRHLLEEIGSDTNKAFIIVLSSLNSEENRNIANLFPEINLIIGADTKKNNISPHLVNNCLITQTGKQGKYQGLLEIIFGKQRIWSKDSVKILADLQNKLGAINWQLKRMEKKAVKSNNKEKHKSTILRLQQEKVELSSTIESVKKDVVQEEKTGMLNDQFIYSFTALKKNKPNDQPTVEKLRILNQKVKTLHKSNRATQKQLDATFSSIKNMLGHTQCKKCHELQAEFWETTSHSKAYETLANKNRSFDSNCLPCHLTINTSLKRVEMNTTIQYLSYPTHLRSVGCESCHGPGKRHSENPEKNPLVRRPDNNACLTCHTPEHDDNFEYPVKLKRISCPAS